MGDAVGEPVHRPVPPVDGAVVQDELGQAGHASLAEHLERVLVVTDGQQRRVVAHVLLEELVRRADPPLPEPGPGAHPLVPDLGRPHVRGLLEQRRPGLPPQLLAEQERRVGAEGDLDRGDRLGRVPHVGESLRRHLQMQLDGCAGRFGGNGGRGGDQPLHAFDIEDEILTAGRGHLVVEEGVPVHVRQVRGDHVVAAERRQDADHHDPGVDLRGFAVGICEPGPQLLGELVEYPAAEPVRENVHLQIEHPQLRLEISAGDALEHLRIPHPRHAVRARQIQLDLQTHEIPGPVEPLVRQEPLQPLQTSGELRAVLLPIGQVKGARHDLLTHRRVPPRVDGPRHRPLLSRSIMPRGSDP